VTTTAYGNPPQTLDEARGMLDQVLNDNEILEESIADLELQMEDRGWVALSMWGQQEFSREGYKRLVENCRLFAITNPLIRRGVQLGIAYVWGQGVTVSARAADDAETGQDVQAVVQAFWDDKSNQRSLTSAKAAEELERALETDGNLFFALFTAPLNGRVQTRSTPFDEIVDVINNPDDRDEPWYYLRQYTTRRQAAGIVGRTVTANWTRREYHPALGFWPATRPKSIDGIPVNWSAPILHVTVNRLTGWTYGIPDVYAAVPWARMYRDFLVDWAKLVKALSRYAYKLSGDKSSKTQKAAAKVRAAADAAKEMARPVDSSNAGAMFATGPGGNLEAIPKSGATIDSDSGRPIAAMAAAAMGVPVTALLADPGVTGARAVAETLDAPTLLEKGLRRKLWADTIQQILDYVIDQAVKAPQGALKGNVGRDPFTGEQVVSLAGESERTVDIDFPEMSKLPVNVLVEAIARADETGKMDPVVVIRLLLTAFEVDNIDEIIDEMTDENGKFIDPDATAGQVAVDRFRDGDPPIEGEPGDE
jgi:hypothetical protein